MAYPSSSGLTELTSEKEQKQWTKDREDWLLLRTRDGIVPLSKRGLSLNVTSGNNADIRSVDVTKFPPVAVSIFLNNYVRGEHVVEQVSIRDLAALIYLAQIFGEYNLLRRINQCLIRCANQSDRDLCLCYVVTSACGLPLRKSLARIICKKFDSIQTTLCECVEDSEMLIPILESCELSVTSEKIVVSFIIDWSLLYHINREQCLQLLNCTRKTFLSPGDLNQLAIYVEQTGVHEFPRPDASNISFHPDQALDSPSDYPFPEEHEKHKTIEEFVKKSDQRIGVTPVEHLMSFRAVYDLNFIDNFVDVAHILQLRENSISVAWAEYLSNPHSNICWNTNHIMYKMPRCGAGPFRTQSSSSKGGTQKKRVTFLTDIQPSTETRRSPSWTARRNLHLQPPRLRKSTIVKNAIAKGFSKIRQKFSRNANN
ncbi:hypothetical protein RB195_007161 [Necator americanus]|uniref:BACK domain-containing protein n=1 Tax=Necator americanus TaxID=51031 RepID=A0ABR1BVY3_NECAM